MKILLLLALFLGVDSLSTADEYLGHVGRWVTVEASAYTPTDVYTKDDQRNPGRKTATGADTRLRQNWYGVAAPQQRAGVPSWNCLPLRSKVIIPRGQGYLDHDTNFQDDAQRTFPVDDTGGIITTRTKQTGRMHIDLRYRAGEEQEARQFGRRRIRIFVIEGPAPQREVVPATVEQPTLNLSGTSASSDFQVELAAPAAEEAVVPAAAPTKRTPLSNEERALWVIIVVASVVFLIRRRKLLR